MGYCPRTRVGQSQTSPSLLGRVYVPANSTKRSKSDSPSHGTYVYVDDFIGAAKENKTGTLLGRMACGILHGIHSMFPSVNS
jgi:hypothetical protein